jgi:hypothetical protein
MSIYYIVGNGTREKGGGVDGEMGWRFGGWVSIWAFWSSPSISQTVFIHYSCFIDGKINWIGM